MNGKTRIIFAFSLGALLFILVGIYSYINTRRYNEDSKWVTHTYLVISKADATLSALQDIETTYRGYIITNNEDYLVPYKEASQNIEVVINDLKKLTDDNAGQQLLLDSITALVEAKKSFSAQAVAARHAGGFEKAQAFIMTNTGENLMKKSRESIKRFIENENKLLVTRQANEEKRFNSVLFIVVASVALFVLLLLVALYYFLKDYDTRIASEQKVLESELRLKKFLDVLPLGVFVLDKDGKAYYVNAKSKEILGRGIVGDGDINSLPEVYQTFKRGTDERYPVSELPIARALKGEMGVVVEDLDILKNGVMVPLRINATAVHGLTGKTEFAISVFEDVTEIKKAEQELIKARQMAEESSMLKEAFLANMSHEIRTPMNAIIGFTNLLLKSRLESKEREYVDIIKSSGENLLHIINDILDISKIEARMMTFDAFPMSIKELFYSLQVTMAQKAGAKNLQLVFKSEPNVPDIVLGDATRLTQILINLVDNALKFTKEGSVAVSAYVISEDEEACLIGFAVKDTGIGISEDKLQKVFERFQQAELHTTRKYGGTGLGLSIAKQLVDFQGGEMKISSEINVGTAFSFTLPFKKVNEGYTAEAAVPVKEFDITELSRYKILLVEDSPVNVKLVQSLFSDLKITIDVVENGKLAVESIKNGDYDLVLMDMEMPEMNGYEATEIIRKELRNPIPIIAMTAHAMAGEKDKCLKLGMNDYISKPINAKLLFEKMYNNIKKEHVETPKKTPEEANGQNSLINLEFLTEMLDGKIKDMLEMLDIFLVEFPKDLGLLGEGIKSGNFLVVEKNAHKMRSTASVVGFAAANPLLLEMEQLARENTDMPRIISLNDNLETLSNVALAEVQQEKMAFTAKL